MKLTYSEHITWQYGESETWEISINGNEMHLSDPEDGGLYAVYQKQGSADPFSATTENAAATEPVAGDTASSEGPESAATDLPEVGTASVDPVCVSTVTYDADGATLYSSTYEYDQAGNMICRTEYDFTAATQTTRNVTYGAPGQPLEENCTISSEDDAFTSRTVYEYASTDDIFPQSCTQYYGSSERVESTGIYEYDDSARTVTYTEYSAQTDEMTAESVYEVTEEPNAAELFPYFRALEITNYAANPKQTTNYEYQWDANGDLSTFTLRIFDADGKELYSDTHTSQYEYESNSRGFLRRQYIYSGDELIQYAESTFVALSEYLKDN